MLSTILTNVMKKGLICIPVWTEKVFKNIIRDIPKNPIEKIRMSKATTRKKYGTRMDSVWPAARSLPTFAADNVLQICFVNNCLILHNLCMQALHSNNALFID